MVRQNYLQNIKTHYLWCNPYHVLLRVYSRTIQSSLRLCTTGLACTVKNGSTHRWEENLQTQRHFWLLKWSSLTLHTHFMWRRTEQGSSGINHTVWTPNCYSGSIDLITYCAATLPNDLNKLTLDERGIFHLKATESMVNTNIYIYIYLLLWRKKI